MQRMNRGRACVGRKRYKCRRREGWKKEEREGDELARFSSSTDSCSIDTYQMIEDGQVGEWVFLV